MWETSIRFHAPEQNLAFWPSSYCAVCIIRNTPSLMSICVKHCGGVAAALWCVEILLCSMPKRLVRVEDKTNAAKYGKNQEGKPDGVCVTPTRLTWKKAVHSVSSQPELGTELQWPNVQI